MPRPIPQRRLLMALVLGVTLPSTGMLAWQTLRQEREHAVERLTETRIAAVALAADTEHLLADARQLLSWAALQPEVAALDESKCGPLFSSFIGQFPRYTNLINVRPNAERVCSAIAASANAPKYVDPHAYLDEAMRSGAFTISQPRIGVFTGRPVLVAAQPIPGAGGQPRGVVALTIDLDQLRLGTQAVNRLPGSDARVVDADGTLVAARGAGQSPGDDVKRSAWFAQLKPGVASVFSTVEDGMPLLVAAAPVRGTGWQAVITRPQDGRRSHLVELLIWTACIVGGGWMAAGWIAGRPSDTRVP